MRKRLHEREVLLHNQENQAMPTKSTSKRELINTGNDKRYVRRDPKGQFKDSDDVGKSLAKDRRTTAKTKSKAGHGDKGDR